MSGESAPRITFEVWNEVEREFELSWFKKTNCRCEYLIQKSLKSLNREVFHVNFATDQILCDALFSLNQQFKITLQQII
jgi:hypothetical protein